MLEPTESILAKYQPVRCKCRCHLDSDLTASYRLAKDLYRDPAHTIGLGHHDGRYPSGKSRKSPARALRPYLTHLDHSTTLNHHPPPYASSPHFLPFTRILRSDEGEIYLGSEV
jgi:hypothetical protein